MSASIRSHFRHKQQPDESSSNVNHKSGSRIPTKSAQPPSIKSEATQHSSKLAKRSSRGLKHPEKPVDGARAGTNVGAGAAEKRSASSALRRDPSAQYQQPAGNAHPNTARNVLQPPPMIRTPSLVSGSSISTFDSPRSVGGLRRKPSSIDRYASQRKPIASPVGLGQATISSRTEQHDPSDGTVLDISCDSSSVCPPGEAFGDHRNPLLERQWHVQYTSSPVPAYAQSVTPSTRYTGSPFSHAPTPSSASSYGSVAVPSSGYIQNAKPTNPERSRLPASGSIKTQIGLPPLRESSTSSSNSTVKPGSIKAGLQRRASTTTPIAKGFAAPTTASRSKQQTTSSSRSAAAPGQIPPELAHLNVDPPSRPSADLHKPLPPLRPSRENTPSITDMKRAAPVVQSDLPRLYTTYHKRTPSQETPVSPSAPSPGLRARFGLSSRSSSRQESPRIDSAVSPPPSARNLAWARSPEAAKSPPRERRRLQRKDSPAVAPEPSPSKSPRFGIFSRKQKSESAKTTEKPKRQPTKGPAAGTGHEGYGQFKFRGRSASSTSSDGFRSPSVDSHVSSVPSSAGALRKGSVASSRDEGGLDDFLRDLQAPKVLRGSGNTFSTAASTSETQGTTMPVPSSSSSVDSYPRPQLLPSAMQGEGSMSLRRRPSLTSRVPSDSSEDDPSARFASLAARRSVHRLSSVDSGAPTRVPLPIKTMTDQSKHSSNGHNVETSASLQSDNAIPGSESGFEGREGLWLRPQNLPTRKPTHKFSFFQRAQASPRPKGKQRAVSPSHTEQFVSAQPQKRNVSTFGMLDPVEPVDLYEIQQLVQESEMSQDESIHEHHHATRVVPYDRRHSNLLPSPPRQESGRQTDQTAWPAPPKITVRHDRSDSPAWLLRAQTAVAQHSPQVVDIPRSPAIDQLVEGDVQQWRETEDPQLQAHCDVQSGVLASEKSSENSSPRHPRLSPVGRIPRVVSKRDREYKLPDSSFSRPRTQNHSNVKPPGTLYNQIRSSRELTSPVEPGSQPVSTTSTRSDAALNGPQSNVYKTSASNVINQTNMNVHDDSDFIVFTPRKNSNACRSTGYENGTSHAPTAALPKPLQDDPWTEYDDLMDDMLPQQTPLSAGSSLGAPFRYADMSWNNSPSLPMPLNLSQPPSTQLPSPPRAHTTPAVLTVPQQVARFLQPSMSPLTTRTATLSGILDHYGNESTVSLASSKHSSISQAPRNSGTPSYRVNGAGNRTSLSSSRYSRGSGHSRSASLPEANVRNSQSSLPPSNRTHENHLFGISEDENDSETAQSTLRFGALMTSKWLSFGQVLFSPAQNEIGLSNDPRVLIIDGLGSDWSYYVALNYPETDVYNLGVAAAPATTSWPGIEKAPPPRLRHIPLASIAAGFPFPKGFFNAVVLRFPVATSDQAYHACLFECKRVLRPGGYLEVAVLDLDLVNMGQKARSVVRGLKTRMQTHDPSVSLRNMSDFMVRLIGRRGFEEIKRGVVGVPVTGHVTKSQSISSVSTGYSSDEPRRPSLARINTQEITFADLLDDARNSQYISDGANDEGITKMVAKVGRWWYSTCYETPLLQNDKSIWQDQGLLRECDKQGTSFRLLLCHAQKPQQTRRRTVSV